MLAEATGKEALAGATRAQLLAEAEGRKQMLLAEAAGAEAQLLAQAKGMQELMDSYNGLTDEQRQILQMKWTLDAMPAIIDRLGDAGEKIMGKVAETVTASLANIDNITVYDGGNGGTDGALARAIKSSPDLMLQMTQLLKATGTTSVISGLLNKAGIDIGAFVSPGDNGRAAAAGN